MFNKLSIIMIVFVWCLCSTALAKTMSVAIDISASNPLLLDRNFAYMAARYVGNEILQLKEGDVVYVTTLGSRKVGANILDSEFKISRKLRSKKVAAIVMKYIQSLPDQKDIAQDSTNIVAWLEFNHRFDCSNNGHILIVTDAIESSSLVSGNQLLQGQKGLPEPEVDLKGCALTMFGIGVGEDVQAARFLRNEWQNWSKQANISVFTPIIP